jgi:heat-inducible transcriptional repressor
VRGAAHLLEDLKAVEDLERVRLLFDELETKRGVIDLLWPRRACRRRPHLYRVGEQAVLALGLLHHRGALSRPGRPHRGVLGVIGPTRLNYARVIPMVDYTAKVVSKIIGG